MLRSIAVLVFGASSLVAQSRVDLLQRVAEHYNNANSFDVKGTASALIPGTSWRVSHHFDTEGAQPTFLPLSVRTTSLQVVSNVGNLTETLATPGATDSRPQRSFGLEPFGRYNDLTLRLLDAQKIGTETVTVQGHAYSCEIIDAVYDDSPKFKPHSSIVHKHLSVAPSELLVLRETKSSGDGFEWTAEVNSFSFDAPPSEMMVNALKSFASQPKDRPDWTGRSIPDLTLTQLSGDRLKLSELRGKPMLLDF